MSTYVGIIHFPPCHAIPCVIRYTTGMHRKNREKDMSGSKKKTHNQTCKGGQTRKGLKVKDHPRD
jgi:hypothetical protein